jgi:hypothetical protein
MKIIRLGFTGVSDAGGMVVETSVGSAVWVVPLACVVKPQEDRLMIKKNANHNTRTRFNTFTSVMLKTLEIDFLFYTGEGFL